MEGFLLLFGIFITIVVLIFLASAVRIVPQMQVLVLERLGKYAGILGSGPHLIVPFIDAPRSVTWTGFPFGMKYIDLREQYTDLPMQPVITKDNVTVGVDSVIYWQITDPYKAVYEVSDLSGGIIQLTITAMRSVMGEMDLDETLSSRDVINSKLRMVMDGATNKWGVKVTRVEVRNINPPEDVRVTMEKQMTAERNRRALVLQAEGEKQAAITRAEGEREAAIARAEGERQMQILRADGAAQARLRAADAEAKSIQMIAQSLAGAGNPAHYLIMGRYIESLRDMAQSQNSKVVFMPVEASNVLSSVGMFKEMFTDNTANATPPNQLPPQAPAPARTAIPTSPPPQYVQR
ncbi:MAG: SPFH domain-containing protein [Chloracidobacterium sp.]|uniref:SPFH/Band 7/PHB domain protein n=1 Tax=Chloracidobacterium validum TaxID=2821543 RepID=A0ABX8B5L0_9BACT|nr:SPFH domain-containing protein [Chloracidobacterium validum]QUW01939.1 SPFH/Band 7/PHB domain protein [Chloracidobacterium validum]